MRLWIIVWRLGLVTIWESQKLSATFQVTGQFSHTNVTHKWTTIRFFYYSFFDEDVHEVGVKPVAPGHLVLREIGERDMYTIRIAQQLPLLRVIPIPFRNESELMEDLKEGDPHGVIQVDRVKKPVVKEPRRA